MKKLFAALLVKGSMKGRAKNLHPLVDIVLSVSVGIGLVIFVVALFLSEADASTLAIVIGMEILWLLVLELVLVTSLISWIVAFARNDDDDDAAEETGPTAIGFSDDGPDHEPTEIAPIPEGRAL